MITPFTHAIKYYSNITNKNHMSSIKEINSAMLNPDNTKSRAILRDAQDKGYITEGNKWIIKGLRALHDSSGKDIQSQDHEEESKDMAALKYMQSLLSR